MEKKYTRKDNFEKKWQRNQLEFLRYGFMFLLLAATCLSPHQDLFGQNETKCTNYRITKDTIIDGELQIFFGCYLIIDPGVKVEFVDNNSKIVVQGGSITAVGTQSAPIRLYSVNPNGWGGIELLSAVHAEFEFCVFNNMNPGVTGNSNNGGIYASATQLSVKQCFFGNNKGGIRAVNDSELTLTNCRFIQNEISGENNGVIYIENSNSSLISGNFFDRNWTNVDGIIAVKFNNKAIIIGNTFSNTSWFDHGTPLNRYPIILSIGKTDYENKTIINGNTFENNINQNNDDSFNIEVREVVLTVGTDFQNPQNTIAFLWNNTFDGGVTSPQPNLTKTAIFARGISLTVSHCDFRNYNKNVMLLQYCNTFINLCSFIDNPTTDGVVRYDNNILYSGSSNLINELYYNTFENNQAHNGGAIWTKITSNDKISLKLHYNSFVNNSANGDLENGNGGAIFIENGGNVIIKKNTFESNSASGNGGAIGVKNPVLAMDIEFNIFKENSASSNGGAISIEQPDSMMNASVNFANNEFFLNEAGAKGGALSISSSNSLVNDQFLITHNHFDDNTSTSQGGALFLSGIGLDAVNNTFVKNSAQFGGAIYGNELLESNFAENVIFNNAATNGGGVYFENINDPGLNEIRTPLLSISFVDNILQNNTYSAYGGGIYIKDCNGLEMVRNYIAFNTRASGTASIAGSGMYVDNSSISVFNCNFTSNEFGSAGTPKNYAISFNLTQDNSLTFTNNNITLHATQGGINFITQVDTANISFHNNLFWGNGDKFNAIRYPYDIGGDEVPPIVTNYCYFDYFEELIDGVNILNNEGTIKPLPGFVNSAHNHRLICSASVCVDAGNPDPIYDDVNWEISCGADTNDIGITGGPKAMNKTHLFTPYQQTSVEPDFIALPSATNGKSIVIREFSRFNIASETTHKRYYQWFFGDGTSTERLEYTGNQNFTYTYDSSVECATVLFVLDTEFGKFSYSQKVEFGSKEDVTEKVIVLKDQTNVEYPKIESSEDVVIYPNPTTGIINLRLQALITENIEIEVIDMNNNRVFQSKIHQTENDAITINLSGKKPGIYFILIKSGDFNFVEKVILN